ncbi:oligoendopeptidase F [Treponema sp. J25]|uniref:oligoendopeptidase F n=1 Tax=Treponema sp. J25 TaxID=2094121 RepID=UPI0010461640|nr:oligoendopeptidase F [Treponema sp. J25]TCW62357.1 oligoendopeptidase F [Treponema sp. J25]
MKTTTIPNRSEVPTEYTWDLSSLYPSDEAWYKDLDLYEEKEKLIGNFRGTLGASAEKLADWLDFYRDLGILEERLAYYCELRQTEDEGAAAARAMTGRFTIIHARINTACAWAIPEIQAIPDERMAQFLEHPRLEEYRIYLKKILRWKPHILSDREERLIAMMSESEGTCQEAFSVLTNVDIDFGSIDTPEGPRPLSQSTWSSFMEKPDRDLRRRAYKAFYQQFEQHKNTLATLYAGSVKQDVIKARLRGFPSARAMALFPDRVDEAVYDNLVATVNRNLGPLHRYYELRKRVLGVPELRHYDVYVPLVQSVKRTTPWEEAVDIISKALAPLGEEYVHTLRSGLLGRWADRYENKGKRSGAFSAGSYTGLPYILMNYKEDVIRDVFTLAHEGGHSMHSWYSSRNNPFMHYGYTIFEAEVASTFNEELLFRYLEQEAETKEMKTYLINKRIDDILATLYRQTMFAEYEQRIHSLEEAGEPLTVDRLRSEYRTLLEKYFGPAMVFEPESDMEGLRIPHFYRAFYVYKYATGISASLALAERVLSGGEKERADYFTFLKSGGSRYPIEALQVAGVDMGSPEPIAQACQTFAQLVERLEQLLG